jgi:outer membrane lipopolysaccharide assembly protein LptE/RlpB
MFFPLRNLLLLAVLALGSCAGYQLGGSKPAPLAEVRTLAVPFFTNKTLFHRAEVLATNASVTALVNDGVYSVVSLDKADAVLEGSVESVDFSQVSTSRTDARRSEELEMVVHIRWAVRGGGTSPRILANGSSTGSTRFFVDPNLQMARTNALSDALERAAQAMVSRLANGW